MEFFKKVFGLTDRINDQIPQQNNNETILKETPVPKFLAEKFPWLENAFRIQGNDCASCKYIGSGLSYGIMIYILTQLRSPPREAIKQRVPFYFAIASMTSTFFILGTCRLFDLGFSAPQFEENVKTFGDYMNEDIESLKKYINNIAGKEIYPPSKKSILLEVEKLMQKENNEKAD